MENWISPQFNMEVHHLAVASDGSIAIVGEAIMADIMTVRAQRGKDFGSFITEGDTHLKAGDMRLAKVQYRDAFELGNTMEDRRAVKYRIQKVRYAERSSRDCRPIITAIQVADFGSFGGMKLIRTSLRRLDRLPA